MPTFAFDTGMTILISIRCKKFLISNALFKPNIIYQHSSGFVVARNQQICEFAGSILWSRAKNKQ